MSNSYKNNKKISTVFSFSCKQMVRAKGYRASTIAIGVIAFLGLLITMLIGAKGSKKPTESDLKDVTCRLIVVNDCDIPEPDGDAAKTLIADIRECLSGSESSNISVEWKGKESLAELSKKEADAVGEDDEIHAIPASVRKTEDGYCVSVVYLDNCAWEEGTVTEIGSALGTAVQTWVERDINEMQAMLVRVQAVGSSIVIGEDTGIAATFIRFIFPLLTGFVMYFMILMYGQDIARSVSLEKTSKLMETMLTYVKPSDLVFGKILCGMVMSVVQILTWIVCGVLGYYVGGGIARMINPDYTNYVAKALDAIRAVAGTMAFSIPVVIVGLLIFFLGLWLYYCLAGIAGSVVTKPEELASANSIIVLPMLISWLIGYFAALNENEHMMSILRYIPFTSPFTVTGEMMVGKISVGVGIISMAEILICSVLMCILAGRIYRGLALYSGEKLSVKKIIGVIRNK